MEPHGVHVLRTEFFCFVHHSAFIFIVIVV